MQEWGRSPGWPTRNSSMPECCSRDLRPQTSSGRGSCSMTPGQSPDNSACGRLRHAFQTPAGKQQNRSTKPTNGSPREVDIDFAPTRISALWQDILIVPKHIVRIVAALERDEPFVLVRTIYRAEAVGGLIGHEVHVAAGRERLHGLAA